MSVNRPFLAALMAAALIPAIAPAVAWAAPACEVPSDLRPARAYPPPEDEVQRGVVNAYYLLAISWSPEWCRTNGHGSTKERLQCDGPARGFVLHGLWPNGATRPYPRYCEAVGPIDRATVRQMFCRTPSPALMQHEWQAHGSCGWTDPKAYFAQSSALYDRLVLPPIESISRRDLTAGAVRAAFTRANPWLPADGIYLQVDKAQRLTEVRLCYDLKFQPMRCLGGTGTPDRIAIRLTPSANRAF